MAPNAFRHGEREPVTFDRGNPGKSDARVSAGRLYDEAAGMQQAFFFCCFYHIKGCAVFHASSGIETFQFDQNPGFQLFFLLYVADFQ